MREEWLDEGGAGSRKVGVKEGLEKRKSWRQEGVGEGTVGRRKSWVKE